MRASPALRQAVARDNQHRKDVDGVMIVLGADAHKRSHTVPAINAMSGQLLGDKTVAVRCPRVRGAGDLGARSRWGAGAPRR